MGGQSAGTHSRIAANGQRICLMTSTRTPPQTAQRLPPPPPRERESPQNHHSKLSWVIWSPTATSRPWSEERCPLWEPAKGGTRLGSPQRAVRASGARKGRRSLWETPTDPKDLGTSQGRPQGPLNGPYTTPSNAPRILPQVHSTNPPLGLTLETDECRFLGLRRTHGWAGVSCVRGGTRK